MFDINQTVQVNELANLNEQLRRNAVAYQSQIAKASAPAGISGVFNPGAAGSVGYQDAAVTAGAGALAPLVPQSIEQTLASATFTLNDLKLWQMIPKVQVTNTLHEYAVINEHGLDLDPFIQEGGGSSSDFGTSQSSYERKSVKIKYMAERRQISDVASLVGIIGANPNAVAEETERGTLSLLRKVESQLFHGNEDTNVLGFDGLIKQISRDGALQENGLRALSQNQKDHAGAALNPETLQSVLGELTSSPRFGKPDFIMCEPKIYSSLIRASIADGRHDSMMLVNYGDRGVQTYGAGPNIHIMGPMGPVPVISSTFLHNQFTAPSASTGASGIPALVRANVTLAEVASPANFTDGATFDGSSIVYKLVAVNNKGYSAPITITGLGSDDSGGAINPSNAQVVEFLFDSTWLAARLAEDANSYVRVYRSEQGGAASTCVLVQEISLAKASANSYGAGTRKFQDWGHNKVGCGNVVIGQMTQDNIEFARLLDFLRKPLASVSAAQQFMLMLFGSPVVKTPKKNFVLRNVLADRLA